MKKYFLYELKKQLWTLIVLTVVCCLVYVVDAFSMMMYWEYPPEVGGGIYDITINNPPLTTIFWCLMVLLFVVPTIVYSFKMSKRSVDGYYSLPLKKEKLYFVATMVGLILVLVPFTVAYWAGYIALLVRPNNPYNMAYFVPTYFAGVCFAVFLFGVNAFVFTRANRTADGVIFMLAYAFVGMVAYEYLWYVAKNYYAGDLGFSFNVESAFTFGCGMLEFVQSMSNLIAGFEGNFEEVGLWFATTIAAGVAGYALLFYLLRNEKGENAEQNSDSWFGYRVLIPIYLALGLGLSGEEFLTWILLLSASLVATIIHKRTFRFRGQDLLPLGSGIVGGVLLMLIVL